MGKLQRIPDQYAQTPEGILLIADGIHNMHIWDGLTATTEDAGLAAPTQAPVIAANQTPGDIIGTYTAYLRFVDKRGNFSNLSPVSNTLVAQITAILTVNNATNTVPIGISTVESHGMMTGNRVRIEGVLGNTAANGTFTVTVTSPTLFELDDTTGSGTYISGGTVAVGVNRIDYSSVQASPFTGIGGDKITRRQLLRNTDGQQTTYYVDVDLTDLVSSTTSSTRNDTDLAAQTAVPLLEPDGSLSANRYGVPPNFKSAVQHHLGRMFATVEVDYKQGAVIVENGISMVWGIGTDWTTEMEGRFLYVANANLSYQILTVDESAQSLNITPNYDEPSDNYAEYAIRPAPAQRRLVYFTEANLPEAWPASNAIGLQEDGDELTGLMTKGSFLYILERRHIYRFTFQTNPGVDGFVFLSAERGCINQRCWVKVEDRAYMLDQSGIHAFTGAGQSVPISQTIQDLFEPNTTGPFKINWDAAELFHASLYPAEETIRFFICLSGFYLPRHALAFDYRSNAWWIEEYPFPISASATGTLAGARRVYLGSEAKRTFLMDSTYTLDGVDPNSGQTRGIATSATQTSLTDNVASFPGSGLEGKSVTIVSGKGEGQRRIIHSATTTILNVIQPWLILPDATSVYQIAGIDWLYRSKWYRYIDSSEQEVRRIGVAFDPVPSEAFMKARIFQDYSKNPVEWGDDRKIDEGEGFGVESNDPDLVASLTNTNGYVQQRLSEFRERDFAGPRFMSLQLTGSSHRDDIVLFFIEYDGVED